jgi:Uncharacterized protein conserved in bacteria (DUF2188)
VVATDQYVVFRASDGQWTVRYDGRQLASFPRKEHAIRAAVTVASETSRSGDKTTVVSEGPGGERYAIWTYGRDSYSD